jgi:DNA polymerase-3 subunit gamma/tau
MGYEPLHHKYRPQTFDELVGQDAIATTLSNALGQQRIAPAYLFCGPRGTGKTSSARILAKSLNCLSREAPTAQPCGTCEVCRGINVGSLLDIVEIDAASNTGVDNIRELIERAQFAPVQCRYKVYVIDECHMLSTAAFNALLKTLEEPPEQVIFVLATTDPQRVLPTIISRCQRFDFRRIPLDAMVSHLATIAQQEAIEITDEAVRLVAQVAQGGLRDAESLLDQLSLLEPPVTAEKVWDLVGAVPERDLLALTNAIAADDSVTALETARRLMDRGREPIIVLQNLAGFYRDLLIAKTASGRSDLVAVTPNTWGRHAGACTRDRPTHPAPWSAGVARRRSAAQKYDPTPSLVRSDADGAAALRHHDNRVSAPRYPTSPYRRAKQRASSASNSPGWNRLRPARAGTTASAGRRRSRPKGTRSSPRDHRPTPPGRSPCRP